jgi:PAS domain S-box-containing protein/putative nucleotidyltransferase with HDIG domain
MADELKILILEDVPADAELIERELRKGEIKFSSKRVDTRKAFLKELKEFEPDLILGDYKLPSFDGISALEIVREKLADIPFIFVSGAIGDELAIETLKRGATDYVLKDGLSRLVPAVNRALREVEERAERKLAEETLEKQSAELQLLFDSTPALIFYKDLNNRIIRANRLWFETFGFSPDRVIGKPLFDFLPKEQAEQLYQDDMEVIESGHPKVGIPEVIETAGGTSRFITSKAPLTNDQGKVVGIIGLAQDITERTQAEEALRESEIRFRTLFESIPDCVLVHDDEGTILHINEFGAQQLEWSAKELVGKNLHEIVTSEQRVLIADHIRETLKMGWCRFETTYVSRSGWHIVAEVNERPIKFGDKKAILRVARDITERKDAEKKLRESEEKYRDLVENIHDILYTMDKNGLVTYIAPAIEFLSGYTPSEIVGRSFLDFVYQEDMPDAERLFQRDMSDQAKPHEYRMVTKAGDVRWARVSSRPIFEGARIIGLRGILTDITVRKRAEEELQRSYQQLRKTFIETVNALASTVEMKDQYTAGHQSRVAHLACTIAEEIGLSPEQMEGIRMAAAIHDIGKIIVPAEILSKPGTLTEIQFEMIKMHPRAGYDILKGIEFPWPVARIILQHHELMNGSGYPQGLSGEEIMVEARILTVADVFEAMTSHRPYRPAFEIQEVLAEISKNSGTLYDTAVVDACIKLFTEKAFKFEEGAETALSSQAALAMKKIEE